MSSHTKDFSTEYRIVKNLNLSIKCRGVEINHRRAKQHMRPDFPRNHRQPKNRIRDKTAVAQSKALKN